MKNNIFLTIVVCALMISMSGCAKKPDQQKVVAKENDYEMTVLDLQEEIMHSPYSTRGEQNLDELLDLAIKRQVLVQEAQRLGLDRNESFMKTIERYWEQTLIKELLDEQTQKVHRGKSPEEQERALAAWMSELQDNAKIKVYKNNLKSLKK